MNQSNEIIDVVDINDNIIGQSYRQQVHDKNLLHRSTHILVFNNTGELFLQKRSMNKDESPGLWDSSAAGHVNSGESYLHCAERELGEELGIKETIDEAMYIPAQINTFWEHIRVYTCVTNKQIIINPFEISKGIYWSLPRIKQTIISNPEIFTSSFMLIFNSHVSE